MSETVRTVIESALELPENDRAKLARAVLLSLEDGIDDNVEEAWDAEIARRVAKVNDGTAVGRPAEDVLDEIRARFQ
ncbi:MAG: putative addiction module component (TIGR02574 family) [Limisphaerales bacterium]|jgi:putative addiction module component (TIGR02574 family)